MAIERITAALFDLRTGDYIRRIPVGSKTTWAQKINGPGDYSLVLPRTPAARLYELHNTARPWEVAVAIMRGTRILQAGPVFSRPLDTTLTLKGAGYWKYLQKRLVASHALASMVIDGEILIDEDNPAPEWVMHLTGSYIDIAAKLLAEANLWQAMPLDLPALTGGIYERTYYGYDEATVAERLTQLTEVINGPELRFDPYLRPDGGIRWRLEGDHEIIDHVWEWNTAIPGQGVKIMQLADDGEGIITQGWGQGGRGGEDGDVLLMTRYDTPTPGNLPLLQGSLSGHSSVSRLDTLRGHVLGMVERSVNTYGQVPLEVPVRYDVRPGDWIDLRTETPVLGRAELPLKVVGVSGGTGDRQRIDTRVRYEE